MVKLVRVSPTDDEVLIACLDVIPSISSHSNQKDVMEEILERDSLDKAVLQRAADVVKGISSSSTREKLQARILDRMTN